MPYADKNIMVAKAQRATINKGVLNLIRAGKTPDAEQVFNAYTGRGGLHGLEYGDFANRHEFTQEKQAFEQGQFFTPDWICQLAAQIVKIDADATVCDPACGHGAFFNHIEARKIVGVDIDQDATDVAAYLYPHAEVVTDDMRSYVPATPFDFIVGNPPFGLRLIDHECPLRNEANEARSEDVFLSFIAKNLRLGGSAIFVVPGHWPKDELLYAKTRKLIAKSFVIEAELLLPSTAFRRSGCESVDTKLVLLRAKLDPAEDLAPIVIDGRNMDAAQLLAAWEAQSGRYMAFRAAARKLRSHLTLEQSRQLAGREDSALAYRFKKYAYQLSLLDSSAAAQAWKQWAEAHKPKPPTMDFDMWEKIRVKPENVFAEVRRAVRAQHKKPQFLVRLHKTKGGVALKSYSSTAAAAVRGQKMFWSTMELAQGAALDLSVLEANLARMNAREAFAPIEFETFNSDKPVRRLRRQMAVWATTLADSATAKSRRQATSFYKSLSAHGVRVEPLQVEKLAQLITKPGGLLSWQQGCGKTLAALGWAKIKRDTDLSTAVREGTTLIVCSSLAAKLQWVPTLAKLGLDAGVPQSCLFWNGALPSYVVITHHQAIRDQAAIKRLAKQKRITQVILDESDEIANRDAMRTRAILNFATQIRHRIVCTGTPARNSAAELFCQLELIFAGSPAFHCVAKTMMVWNTDIKDLIETKNPNFGARYERFKGLSLFRDSHAPRKPTVLGEHRSVPLVPCRQALGEFLGTVRSRMLLSDLLGRNPLAITTTTVEFSPEENALYDFVLENTRELIKRDMETNDESRKLSQLALAHAIRILQQTCSIPERFPEFKGKTTAKREYIATRCRQSDASHIAVGTIWKDAAAQLADHLRASDTTREVFIFDGEESFSQRAKILATFAESPRAVLVTTQQALRSSVNVHVVSEVIAEALPWNFSALEQWARRFVRYNNKSAQVALELLVVKDTLEERILGLLLKKEGVAQIAAGDQLAENEELYGRYGIDGSDLDLLAEYLHGLRDESLRADSEHSRRRERRAA